MSLDEELVKIDVLPCDDDTLLWKSQQIIEDGSLLMDNGEVRAIFAKKEDANFFHLALVNARLHPIK